jgi:hypothetical protein
MKKKTRSILKKYQFGTPLGSSFGGFKSQTLETWEPSTSYSNVIDDGGSSGASGQEIAGGVAGGLNAIAGGLSSAAAGMRANTKSEIDPNSIYAYDPSKSGFQGHKKSATTTASVLGAAGGVASSIPGPGQIIGAGLNVGAAGTEMGLADLEKRLIRAHDAMYKQRMNVGGKDGNFTTQGQFTTREAQEDPGIPMAKMGGGLYANIHAKRARIKAGSGEKMRSPGDKGAPSAANFERAARTSNKQMGGSVPAYGASGMVEYGKGGYLKQYQVGGYKKEDLTKRDEEAIQRYLDSSTAKSMERFGMATRNTDSLRLMNRFSNTESFYNPYNNEFYKKENVSLGKPPTPLSEMKTGGMAVSNGVPRKYANAELEGREIIEKAKGPDIYVQGPSHENGGVPMMLEGGSPAQGGDYVWSDHLTYKGKTMAELYAMAVQSGASEQEIDQLRMLQEQLAGRAGDPQDAKELQEMPMAKTGGMLKKYRKGSGALGEKSFGEQLANYTPEIASGVGAIAQLGAILGAKNPYKGMKAPKPNLIATPEKQFYERTDSRAQEAANQRGAALSKQLLQQAGFGPGETSALQKVELDRAAADAQATQQAREFNIQQDRAEKQLNTEMKLRVGLANQEALNKAAESQYALALEERMFETERAQAGAGAVAGTAKDIASISGDYREALAIQGKQLNRRARTYDPEKAEAKIKADNPFDEKKETRTEYERRIQQLMNEDAKAHQDYLNSKR